MRSYYMKECITIHNDFQYIFIQNNEYDSSKNFHLLDCNRTGGKFSLSKSLYKFPVDCANVKLYSTAGGNAI